DVEITLIGAGEEDSVGGDEGGETVVGGDEGEDTTAGGGDEGAIGDDEGTTGGDEEGEITATTTDEGEVKPDGEEATVADNDAAGQSEGTFNDLSIYTATAANDGAAQSASAVQ
ncbi:MAG: hypothetical protein ABR589_10945, partial [Chthoniobacterales bacterium]